MRKGTAYREGKTRRESLREIVFEAIKKENKGISTSELVFATKLKIHSLSGRLAELEQDGLIYQKGLKIEGSNRAFTVWKSTEPELIEVRKNENWNKRLFLWLNKGRKNGFISAKELEQLKKQSKLFT